jgi:hypothetical protein
MADVAALSERFRSPALQEMNGGPSRPLGKNSAVGLLYGLVQRHAVMLTFVECLRVLSVALLVLIPLLFLMKKSNPQGGLLGH